MRYVQEDNHSVMLRSVARLPVLSYLITNSFLFWTCLKKGSNLQRFLDASHRLFLPLHPSTSRYICPPPPCSASRRVYSARFETVCVLDGDTVPRLPPSILLAVSFVT